MKNVTEIKNINDLVNFLLNNNIINDIEVLNIYKEENHVEVYSINSENPLPWFEDNFFKIYLPKEKVLKIEYVDYDEEIDIEERVDVKKFFRNKILPLTGCKLEEVVYC